MRDSKLRISSDRYNQFTEGMGGFSGDNVIPVDLYGKRVYPNKNDSANLVNAAKDIQEYYDLTGTAGLKPEGSSHDSQPKELRKVEGAGK
mgnify:CR=1 FL=1